MILTQDRPIYNKYAWAYDKILERPAINTNDFIYRELQDKKILQGSKILDAGCGSGKHALYLSKRGYSVVGIDISDSFIELAKSQLRIWKKNPCFIKQDLLSIRYEETFSAILCKGVLNDILDYNDRTRLFKKFRLALKEGGIMIFDVREWHKSKQLKAQEEVFIRRVQAKKRILEITRMTKLVEETKSLNITENHVFQEDNIRKIEECNFQKRCWTISEIKERLYKENFEILKIAHDYTNQLLPDSDKIVVIARRK